MRAAPGPQLRGRPLALALCAALALAACRTPSKSCWADLEAAQRAGTSEALEDFLRQYPYYPYEASVRMEIQRIANRSLLAALHARDRGRVRALLKSGANPDGSDGVPWGEPLRAAALGGDPAMCTLLLRRRADVEATDEWGNSVLAVAARAGQAATAEVLLERGADAGAAGEMGQTPLHFAFAAGAERLVGRLLAAGADPERRNAFGLRPREMPRARALEDALRLWLDALADDAGAAAPRATLAVAEPAPLACALVTLVLHEEAQRGELLALAGELGLPELEQGLLLALERHGTRPMAEDYLAAGNEALARAARAWAAQHGQELRVRSQATFSPDAHR